MSDERNIDEEEGGSGLKIAIVLLILVGGVVALLLTTDAGNVVAYGADLGEIVTRPQEFQGRQVTVQGELRQGSILFREDPCEWRFVLEEKPGEGVEVQDEEKRSMAVAFPQCVVPDTFRDGFGIEVTVQGQIQTDGVFLASEVMARCPSKYEMQERLEAGEEMPHEGPLSAASSSGEAQAL